MLLGGAILLLATFEATQMAVRYSLPVWRAPWSVLITRSIVSWTVIGALAVAVWRFAVAIPLAPLRATTLVAHGVGMASFVVLHVLVTASILSALFPAFAMGQTLSFIGVAYVIFDLVLYAFIVGVANSWRYAQLAAQRELAAVQLAESLQRERLDALRRQLDPHFLFNTLNAIAALALRGNGPATADAIAVLSELLRESLRDDTASVHPLHRELANITNYLSILEMRFPGHVTLHREITQDASNALVPCLALQPLVENAVRHGLGEGAERGAITIRAAVASDRLTIHVDDNGVGLRGEPADGIGLASLRARLQHAYGARSVLSVSPGPNGAGTRSTIEIPHVPAPPLESADHRTPLDLPACEATRDSLHGP